MSIHADGYPEALDEKVLPEERYFYEKTFL
jgi:hypothetical protein